MVDELGAMRGGDDGSLGLDCLRLLEECPDLAG